MGGVKVYEAYEVKTKKRKITLSFTSPETEQYFLYLWSDYMGKIKKKLC